jgi:choline dehydrogenase-like flavoprotein
VFVVKVYLSSVLISLSFQLLKGKTFATGVEYLNSEGNLSVVKLRNPCSKNSAAKYQSGASAVSTCNRPSEVIVTAGALLTPKVLMNSGIGDISVLESLGITPVVSSPRVGQNLQDHPALGFIVSVDPTVSASYPKTFDFANLWANYILSVESGSTNAQVIVFAHFLLG